jgi:dTDP-4-dehydrorhamnose 3,5-epimerase-like enzyme
MPVPMEHVKVHADSRGVVFEPLEPVNLGIQRNTHIAISVPGVVRGNHYHLQGTETTAVTGPSLVRIKENNKIRDIKVPPNQVYRFTIPPKVSHAFKNIGDQPNILVGFNTVKHDPQNPDLVEDILMSR